MEPSILLTTEVAKKSLEWPEYVVFGATLLISLSIGVYYGFFGSKQKTTKEYLLADRSMSAFPVSLSLVCSAVSAVSLLGNPVEIYLYGTQLLMIILAYIPFSLALSYIYLPVYFNLQVDSAYQYIEMRFNNTARLIVSILSVLHLVATMAITVYAPSLAINQVTGIDTKVSTAIIYFVCIFYSALGGLKAVLWTDVFQAFIMLGSIVAIIIQASIDMGGLPAIWQVAQDHGRIVLFNFDPDIRTRHTIWTCVIAGYFLLMPSYAATQMQIQRFLCMPDLKTARKSLIMNWIGLTVIIGLSCVVGVVVFAKYQDCDPITSGKVSSSDQLLPFYVSETVGNLPGLMGVFIAGITCASMSTLSSGLSALTSIVTYDYLSKIYPNLSDEKISRLSKINCFLLGVISYLFVFIVENMGSILPATNAILGIFIGPIFGLFSMGMIFPSANSKGAIGGMVVSFLVMIGYIVAQQIASSHNLLPDQRLPLSTSGCDAGGSNSSTTTSYPNYFFSSSNTPSEQPTHTSWKDKDDSFGIQLLSISYLWYPAVGYFVSVISGLAISSVYNMKRGAKEPRHVDPTHISPVILWLWERFCPELSKSWFHKAIVEQEMSKSDSSGDYEKN